MTYRHSRHRASPGSSASLPGSFIRRALTSLWSALWSLLLWGPAVLALVGLFMRLVLRDRVGFLAYLHYGTPWSVIALAAFAAAVIGWVRRRGSGRSGVWSRAASWTFLSLGVVAALAWWFADFERGKPAVAVDAERGPVMRVVVWNAEGQLRWPAVLGALRDADPDVALVVESGGISRTSGRVKRAFSPTHRTWSPSGGMTVLSRADMTPDADSQRDGSGWWNYDPVNRFLGFSTRFEGRPVRFLGVDVYSQITNSRRVALGFVARMAARDDIPTVVFGDFNTPADSLHFADLRAQFDHAFEQAGSGYAATWPEPVPVLQIDHVWVERGAFEVVQVQQIDTGLSDHRMLVVDLQFVE